MQAADLGAALPPPPLPPPAPAGKAVLTYFVGRGRAEQCRWALAAAGVAWADRGLETVAEMEKMRADGELAFDQVPMLAVPAGDHGALKRLTQTMAIIRYAARKGGLIGGGRSDEAEARIDELVEGVASARGGILGYPFSESPEVGMEKIVAMREKYWRGLDNLAAAAAANGDGAVGGGALSLAEVLLAELVQSNLEAAHGGDGEALLAPYPALRAAWVHVLALDRIKAYLAGPQRQPWPEGDVGRAYWRNVQVVLGRIK